jgi:hypothetical protein
MERAPPVAPELVGDTVADGLPQVRPQRIAPSGLEAVEVSERADDRVLDEVGGVGEVAHAAPQPPVCPPTQRRQQPGEEPVEGVAVAVSGSSEERERGRRAAGDR